MHTIVYIFAVIGLVVTVGGACLAAAFIHQISTKGWNQ